MTLTVGTDSYVSLADSHTYHQNHGNSSWTDYRKTVLSIQTHVSGILISVSSSSGYALGDRVALYGTVNYNVVGTVVLILSTVSFVLDITFVANESTGYCVSETLETCIRKATEWIDNHPNYKGNWKGSISDEDQVLSFPRTGLYDEEGRSLDDDTIPDKIEAACCEMALKCLTETIFPDISQKSRGLRRERVDVLEKEWFAPSTSNLRKKYDYVDNLLSGFVRKSGNSISLRRVY